MQLLTPAIFQSVPGLRAGMSTRHGGVSAGPYASMNLDHRGPDDAALREENRRRFCAAMGFGPEALARSLQVHGTALLEVEEGGLYEGYDALMTRKKGVLLSVSIADCTPILIADSVTGALAAVHAGWRGTVGGIVEQTLHALHARYGTQPCDCRAWIGPCIDVCTFEVGDEVAALFAPDCKQWNASAGKFFVDLKKANLLQLLKNGVPERQVEVSPLSTALNIQDFYSYRAEGGVTGRMLAAIGYRE